MRYLCQNAAAQPKTCDFSTGKVVLQQEISREQVMKLLGEGKTDLLVGFKSSRTGRNFKAYLVKQPDGKIGFEFEARPARKTAAAKRDEEKADGDTVVDEPAKKPRARKTTATKKSAPKN